jgi:hypothetical protein
VASILVSVKAWVSKNLKRIKRHHCMNKRMDGKHLSEINKIKQLEENKVDV